MDVELENYLDPNNTDDLDNYSYEPSAWEYTIDVFAVMFTILGIAANMILIYVIARNVQMRTKTNLLIMNIAINDLCFLLVNMHFLSALFELLGIYHHFQIFFTCMFRMIDVTFQFNEVLLIIILLSNWLMKNVGIRLIWVTGTVYTFVGISFVFYQTVCHNTGMAHPFLYIISAFAFLVLFLMVLFKEFNNCYKKFYKKDPLSKSTSLRFTIGRIFIASWGLTFFFYALDMPGVRYISWLLASQSLMASAYILLYLVCVDKHFQICFLNIFQCKGTNGYDVDATITFADEADEVVEVNNQVNITFNSDLIHY